MKITQRTVERTIRLFERALPPPALPPVVGPGVRRGRKTMKKKESEI